MFAVHRVDHKKQLPLHYDVYLAHCASKRASSASVESVYSGATKFSNEAETADDSLLQLYVFCHYNWNLLFLRPDMKQMVSTYRHFHSNDFIHQDEFIHCVLDNEDEEDEPAQQTVL